MTNSLTKYAIEGYRKRVLESTMPLEDFEYPGAFSGLGPVPKEARESFYSQNGSSNRKHNK